MPCHRPQINLFKVGLKRLTNFTHCYAANKKSTDLYFLDVIMPRCSEANHKSLSGFQLVTDLRHYDPCQTYNSCSEKVPKKGDFTRVENYRGIALSSVISKTLNRVIRNRMTPAFEEILRLKQNGFRPGISTSSHVLGLRRILEGARAKQITAVLLFVDLSVFKLIHQF
eukprot:sb/3472272/